jgi:ribosome-binding factor A
MASYNRTKRIGEEIRKVVSSILIAGIKDYRINSMVSVTDVEVTTDLKYAYIYVSVLGGDREATLAGLKSASGYVRREVGKAVNLRYTPEIIFKIDDSIEKGVYMSTLIRKVNEKHSDSSEVEDEYEEEIDEDDFEEESEDDSNE